MSRLVMRSPRHVALNALFLDPGRSSGTETYLRGLAPALAAEFPALTLTVLTTRRGAAALRADGWTDFARIVHFPFDDGQRSRRLFAEQVAIGAAARRRGVDVLHSLASTGPAVAGTRSVVTLHDVTFFRLRTFSLVTTLALQASVRCAVHAADVLVTGSAAARDEACDVLGLDRDRFTVVPHGPGKPTGPAAPVEDVQRLLRLGAGRVVLCIGAVRPHKNQRQLIEALPHLPDDVVLVLAGAQEQAAEEVTALAQATGMSGRLRMPGYLADDQVEGLWELAACAAFPTRAEGFGLPVLEAMRRGVPVACADLPVLREVGGDLPHYFPLDDPPATAAAILAAMADREAARRGPERAGRFSWEAAAHGTYEAYERALCTSD
jgi:glycosyltransferase involved in cell wall biosynthesis